MDYENICVECSKPFTTTDEDMNYCPNCWKRMMSETFKDINEFDEDNKEENVE